MGKTRWAKRVTGGIFSPQSPHHPACGSAPGGSQSKPSRSWAVNDHSQFFDRMQEITGIGRFNAAPLEREIREQIYFLKQ